MGLGVSAFVQPNFLSLDDRWPPDNCRKALNVDEDARATSLFYEALKFLDVHLVLRLSLHAAWRHCADPASGGTGTVASIAWVMAGDDIQRSRSSAP